MKTLPSLWDYACALYKNPAVKAACMSLQDEHGLNTPLLLFACWQLKYRGYIDQSIFIKAQAQVTPVDQSVVTPLREIRRAIKTDNTFAEPQWQQLYKDIAASELKAEALLLERLEQDALAAFEEESVVPRLSSLQALAQAVYFTSETSLADRLAIGHYLSELHKANSHD